MANTQKQTNGQQTANEKQLPARNISPEAAGPGAETGSPRRTGEGAANEQAWCPSLQFQLSVYFMTREMQPVMELTGAALVQESEEIVTLLLRGAGGEGDGDGRVSMKCVNTHILATGTRSSYLFLAHGRAQARSPTATHTRTNTRMTPPTTCQRVVPRPSADSSPERASAGPGEEGERRTAGIFAAKN